MGKREINPVAETVWGNWLSGSGACHRCPNRDETMRWQPAMSGGNANSDLAFVALEPASGGNRVSKNHPDNNHNKPIPDSYSNAEYWSEDWLMSKKDKDFMNFLESVMGYIGTASSDYYFTNSKKCHNIEGNHEGEENPNEIARSKCSSYLHPELEFVNPSVIVALGAKSIAKVRSYVGEYVDSRPKKSALSITDSEPILIPSYHWSAYSHHLSGCENFDGDSWEEYYQELGNLIAESLK